MAKIILINKEKISLRNIQEIIETVELPEGRILLILHDGNLINNNQGICIPKSLLRYSRGVRVFDQYGHDRWDCGIAISHKYCSLSSDFPAYFVYLLGHELGHSSICLSNVSTHIHYCLIEKYIGLALNNKIILWHELPHEKLFDQFGIYCAEKIFSRSVFNEEIKKLIKVNDGKDILRLNNLLQLPASID